MFFIGIDLGSSSVKVSLIEGENGQCKASAFYPKKEMNIIAVKAGWAEQRPEDWWSNLKLALQDVLSQAKVDKKDIKAIGISYQMHGLVVVDKDLKPLRPSIIWCDSRAAAIGQKAFSELGNEECLSHLLNSPGNFTASKLRWVQENEQNLYKNIYKIMLPGDYIAMKMSGKAQTTVSGLSEGMFWDFKNNAPSELLMKYYGIDSSLLSEIVPTFGIQSELTESAAFELGLQAGTKITYRAGDQPNNALSLNVLQPGEIATTAGTSGVVYGVSSEIKYDPQSRVNTFAHVNHTEKDSRLGVLLCINGTGILNSWLHNTIGLGNLSYDDMNELSQKAPIGSGGMCVLPFGNGAERVLKDKNIGAHVIYLSLTTHNSSHIIRAAHEGIAFSFKYGMDIMSGIGISPKVIRAGMANMFQSPVFRETLAGISGASIELYNTDGSVGAARGAAIGYGYYKSFEEAFIGLKILETVDPIKENKSAYTEAYERWKNELEIRLK
jgi:xylulokinase